MLKLHGHYITKKVLKLAIVVLVFSGYTAIAVFLILEVGTIKRKAGEIETGYTRIKESQEAFSQNFPEELFNEHLALMDKSELENELNSMETEFEKMKSSGDDDFEVQLEKVYGTYGDFEAKLKRNDSVKLDTSGMQNDISAWGLMLINKELDALESSISSQNESLDKSYQSYLAEIAKKEAEKNARLYSGGAAAQGYSYLTVKTERGTTHGVYLIKVPLSEYRVKTVAAIENDCKDNCPTKNLQQYVTENGAYAGMTGSYACPPDYSSCEGKVNSFDFAFYDSNDKKWFNKGALTWFKTGMLTFKDKSYSFYKKTSEYDGDSVTAGISNFPSMLKNGEEVVDEGTLTSYQKVRALRGAIGVSSDHIYLAYITNASVIEAAYAMKSLGAKHALNLDGGGTAAMYIGGGYKVGPGRGVANAILLIK